MYGADSGAISLIEDKFQAYNLREYYLQKDGNDAQSKNLNIHSSCSPDPAFFSKRWSIIHLDNASIVLTMQAAKSPTRMGFRSLDEICPSLARLGYYDS